MLASFDNKKEILNSLNAVIKSGQVDSNLVSDGYHTFGELYEHRIALFIALCKELKESYALALHHRQARGFAVIEKDAGIWKSKTHSDGSVWDGWFILGIDKVAGDQITYHLPMSKWDECSFAEELDKAPDYDGHTPNDVLQRLKNI